MNALYTIALAATALGAAARPALAPDTLAGVTMPNQVEVDGQRLVLNGMALRKKAIFKVYVAGLYLPAPERSAERVLAADAPRRVVLQLLRDVDKGKMCDAWNEGLAANTPNAAPALKQQFSTLCGWMEDVREGEQFAFTYLPGRGTRVEVRGKTKGTLEGKPFADALFAVWIGPKPGPGEEFKKGLMKG
jgi:hypothetical protein